MENAKCACLVVKYSPVKLQTETRDNWACDNCGRKFVQREILRQEESKLDIALEKLEHTEAALEYEKSQHKELEDENVRRVFHELTAPNESKVVVPLGQYPTVDKNAELKVTIEKSRLEQASLEALEHKEESKMDRPTFAEILHELNAMQVRKGKDYGSGDDSLANICDSATFGIAPWVSAMVRANDKMARIKTFIKKGSLENEKVEDSLVDLAVYTIHALRLYREQHIETEDVPLKVSLKEYRAFQEAVPGPEETE